MRIGDDGFGMVRAGYLADYLGPVVADTAEAAEELIGDLLKDSCGEQVFWDVMNPHAADIARAHQFCPVRDLTRMWIGEHCISPPMDLQYAISDPGTG